MEFLMALKAFMIIYCVFKNYDSSLFFPFSIDTLHLTFVARLNQAVIPFGIAERDLPIDYTYSIFAFVGAIISFIVVRIQIKFAYYLFFFLSTE